MLSKNLVVWFLLTAVTAAAAPPQAPTYPLWPLTPVQKAEPKAQDTLPKGKLYVVLHNDAPVQLLVSPADVASVREYKDAVTIDGDFVDGGLETRDYKAKQIFLVKRLLPGPFELLKVPAGPVERKALLDPAPAPKPVPTPTPTPTPVPSPAPIPADGFRVLIVYDDMKGATLPSSQAAILVSADLYTYLDSKCVKVGNEPERRIWASSTDGYLDSPIWGDAMKRPRESLPWIVISDGKTGYEGPLPKTVADTIALIKKYGG